MKILFLTRAYGKNAGGMERLSYELVQHASRQPGVESKVIAHWGSRVTSPLFNFSALLRALSAARKVDVIHIGDPMLALLGWKLKGLTGKPVAVTVHGLDITYPNRFYQLYLKFFFQNFDYYFPISQHVASLLKNHNMRGQVAVVKPGISDRFYDPNITRDQLVTLLSQDLKDKKVLFTSGRLVKRKGHEWFIRDVLPQLPKNVIYVIAGDGPHFASILEASRGRPEKVIMLGRVSDEQLKILYNTVDAFIMPNIPVENDAEGFGLVLLEAALCNRPIFASNLEGIPDAIHDGRNGTLLPPGNAGAWAASLSHFLVEQSPIHSARPYTLQHFSWEKTAHEFLTALAQRIDK
ncbi:MAG: glycosyltransferase family 4 protein [Patescibacteria group bacterium]